MGIFELDVARVLESFSIAVISGGTLALFLSPKKYGLALSIIFAGFLILVVSLLFRNRSERKQETFENELDVAKLKNKKPKDNIYYS